ncbi:exodeoxyribonuclease V subunit alpha [Actinomycetospora sp. TBRC 11914]|uniref:exodeoxyribonuclease V subunit alpha n=1 Tax=Actinomycetospora sp. TBRC 11914 TaxID=2729387 RepID=UPI00145FCCC1|nr:exodeoxyribonuclease V subunit alpha [Actinomycetospora sp. TBRC 11914]NMO91992.1 exodeoxyribonuclease V subunit alpha [Actinomycetospora sp. TBRC 11914]
MTILDPTTRAALAAEDGLRLAVRATGLLATFGARGVLAPSDVAVARRLGRLGGETDEEVLLAAALTVRALRSGSVCLELADVDRRVLGEDDALVPTDDLPWPEPAGWAAALAASPLTAPGGPLRLDDGLLWLDRYRRQEDQVRDDLTARSVAAPPSVDPARLRAALDRLFGDVGADDHQRLACAVATLRWTAVVAGGPGTGKTTTVARLLAVLRDQDPGLRIALAAPTGKAAARLGEAIGEERLPDADRARVGTPEASTIHRLLGPRADTSSRFRHDRHRRLPHDVVVVDETSMVSLTLMARLLEAVRDDARVVFVGDPDQLASVEAGAVLGDLVSAPDLAGAAARDDVLGAALDAAGCTSRPAANGVVRLDRNYRNNADIAALAAAIRAGDADAALERLRGAASLEFVEYDDAAALTEREPAGLEGLREEVVSGAREVAAAARTGDADTALEQAEEHRLLCAHRRGPYGVSRWAAQVERWLDRADEDGDVLVDPDRAAGAEWWPGRPLLVTANDYDLGLYNGDTGVVVELPTPGGGTRPVAVFSRGGTPLQRSPALLSGVQTVHAMTVHRAQGSQYARVSVLLPPPESPLLTRELLYTAVTRARTGVRVVGSAEAVRAAVERPVSRASGFARRVP